ncbi:MAG: hypothetical protein AMXMBFR33_19390 [Candidatus Xenobia bacterium]
MFLRKSGRKFLLLHSYREGGSRVRQLTLRQFEGVSGLRVALTRAGWRALQEELEQEFPHLEVDWDGLNGKLAEIVGREAIREVEESSREATARGEKRREQAIDSAEAGAQILRRTARRLRRLLLESNPESLRLAGRELNELGGLISQVAPQESEGVERELAAAAAIEQAGALQSAAADTLEAVNGRAARGRLRRAQRLRPWDGGLWRLEGDLLVRHRRWREAEKAYREAARLDRHSLPTNRRVFHPEEPAAQPYLLDLEGLATVLERQGRLEEACQVLGERVRLCPEPAAREALGAALHRAGQFQRARQEFSKLPDHDWRRHYHEAATWLEQGAALKGLEVLLRAIARNDGPACTLPPRFRRGTRVERPDYHYWEQFGELWGEEARRFLRAVREERMVRFRMTELGKRRYRVRKVMPPELMRKVARRALARLLDPELAA